MNIIKKKCQKQKYSHTYIRTHTHAGQTRNTRLNYSIGRKNYHTNLLFGKTVKKTTDNCCFLSLVAVHVLSEPIIQVETYRWSHFVYISNKNKHVKCTYSKKTVYESILMEPE